MENHEKKPPKNRILREVLEEIAQSRKGEITNWANWSNWGNWTNNWGNWTNWGNY